MSALGESSATSSGATPHTESTTVVYVSSAGSRAELSSLHTVGWSIGSTCPFSCNHCYTRKVREDSKTGGDWSLQELAGALIDAEVPHVVLGGNEPIYTPSTDIARSELPHLIETLAHAGINVVLVTAGPTIRALKDHWPDVLECVALAAVSIDSPDAQEHDRNRGARLHRIAVDALEQLQEVGVPSAVITSAMEWNFSDRHIDGFLALAERHRAYLRVNVVKPTGSDASRLPARDTLVHGYRRLLAESTSVVVTEPLAVALAGLPRRPHACGRTSLRINVPDALGRTTVVSCQYSTTDGAVTLGEQGLDGAWAATRRAAPRPHPACSGQDWASVVDPLPRTDVRLADDVSVEPFREYLCTWVGRTW